MTGIELYVVLSGLFFLFLGLIWRNSDGFNMTLKMIMIGLAIWAGFFIIKWQLNHEICQLQQLKQAEKVIETYQ